MSEHEHDKEVAMFGECLTCVVRENTRDDRLHVETPVTGRTLAQEGIDRADRAAPADWRTRARVALRVLAESQPTVLGDDLWEHIESPPEPRASGAVFQWARAQGLIEPTDEFVASRRPSLHASPIRVWRSLVFAR